MIGCTVLCKGKYHTCIKTFSLIEINREILKELKARILKEYKPVLRQAEKLRERFSQRYTRHTRALQDRRLRDKSLLVKTVKDNFSAVKLHEDKTIAQMQKDIKSWSNNLSQKIDLGKSVFLGTYVEVSCDYFVLTN